MSASVERIADHRLHGGWQYRYRHPSQATGVPMTYSVFVPPKAVDKRPLQVRFWLSGLTCNDENLTTKAGAQRLAAELNLLLVMPDTSPRSEAVADDEAYDLGQGAGFYLNATIPPWSSHYRMSDYLSDELPALIRQQFRTGDRQSIMGHSMGGHGALLMVLRHPGRYCSASAFAPIVNPSEVPRGRKAFGESLGLDESQWRQWDSCRLLAGDDVQPLPVLIDQGDADPFLPEPLQPEKGAVLARQRQWPLTLRIPPGYDHSSFFIASFIDNHLRFHAGYLHV